MALGTVQQKQNDEAALIAAILAGDSQHFHELIRPYERTVYMTALSILKNEADAEEVAQEAFLKAFRYISTFRAESKFGTWLISIVLNEARARLRRQAIVHMESIDDTSNEGAGVSPALLRDWREIPLQAVEQKEIREMLHGAVKLAGHLQTGFPASRWKNSAWLKPRRPLPSALRPSRSDSIERVCCCKSSLARFSRKLTPRKNGGGFHGLELQACLGIPLRLSGRGTTR